MDTTKNRAHNSSPHPLFCLHSCLWVNKGSVGWVLAEELHHLMVGGAGPSSPLWVMEGLASAAAQSTRLSLRSETGLQLFGARVKCQVVSPDFSSWEVNSIPENHGIIPLILSANRPNILKPSPEISASLHHRTSLTIPVFITSTSSSFLFLSLKTSCPILWSPSTFHEDYIENRFKDN